MAEICKSDLANVIRQLEYASTLFRTQPSTRYHNRARITNILINKLKSKLKKSK